MKYFSAITGLILLVSGIILPEIIGLMRDDYNFANNYLSELGAHKARYALIVNSYGFLPVGITVSLLVIYLRRTLPGSLLITLGAISILGVAVGYFGAFFFPCELGCAPSTGAKQIVHFLTGIIEYAGGITGLLLMFLGLRSVNSKGLSAITLIAAICMLTGFVLMLIPQANEMKGLWQRLADYSFFAWLIVASNRTLLFSKAD